MRKDSPIVISDTTPIIALSTVGQLDLLQKLYGEVLIPAAVEREILTGGTRIGAAELQSAPYVRTVALNDPRRADLLNDLDRGEAEAIALALEKNADLVIIDERLGRRHAQRLGLTIVGSLGILIRAKRLGHIDTIAPLIERMRARGIHLGEALVEQALLLAGEREL